MVGTFSKSRSLAGGRLGYGIACKELIADLEKIRFSINPYNVNKMTEACGIGSILDKEYFEKNCRAIKENRRYLVDSLTSLGFDVAPSAANFILAKKEGVSGKKLFEGLKEKGILVRRFDMPKISEYLRITIGSKEDMETLVKAIKELL